MLKLDKYMGVLPVCDKCGKPMHWEDNIYAARQAMKNIGWAQLPPVKKGDRWEHYCPECRKELGLY